MIIYNYNITYNKNINIPIKKKILFELNINFWLKQSIDGLLHLLPNANFPWPLSISFNKSFTL